MIVLLLGPPECGKTTQADRLFGRMGLPSVDIGELLQQASEQGRIPPQDAQGGYDVSDEEVVQLLVETAGREAYADGFCIEAFPSTAQQAQMLEQALGQIGQRIGAAVFLDIGDDIWPADNADVLDFLRDRDILYQIDGRPFVEDVEEHLRARARAPPPRLPTTRRVDSVGPPEPHGGSGGGGAGAVDRPADQAAGGELRERVNHIPVTENSVQYRSSQRMKEDHRRHDRPKHDPSVKFSAPVTAAQEIGWSVKAPEYYKKDAELYHPRMKSRETMFAEALILGPRHP
eukprot:CAMPEP_0180259980 /NCGR_PEP_ID=MMETSP0987-20121128/43313_1 /TAXON_ID=697907 /ORGANISM="non described non described, Strain CCMP2293" /LENGTH=287 /DNA_ID=CAMNT_0022229731 /DNA_START=153 /DNA_END=1017 /DNA_ORIENTATION=+